MVVIFERSFLNSLPAKAGNSNPARFHKAKVTGHTALRRGLTQHVRDKALTALRRNLYVAVHKNYFVAGTISQKTFRHSS